MNSKNETPAQLSLSQLRYWREIFGEKKWVLLLMFGGILFYTGIAGSGGDVENTGVEIILLSGGEKARDIHFPHHRHQDVLGDCNICHDLFPKKLGSMQEPKNQGKLKKKQVMQEHCVDCHEKMKAAGRNTGPTSCARCHRKTG